MRNVVHHMGVRSDLNQPSWKIYFPDCLLAEVNFIDGQALDPSHFGEYNSVYNNWVAKKYTGAYGTNGFYLSFDGAGTKHAITANGGAQHSTAQSKIGGSSIAFDGSGDKLTTPNHNDFASWSSFTVECWYRGTGNTGLVGTLYGTGGWNLCRRSTGELILYIDGGANKIGGSASDITDNTWHHIAMVRNGASGNTIQLYVDGVAKGSTTSGFTGDSTNDLWIGMRNNGGGDWDLNGYLDEIRISNTARYTSGFTPSTTAFAEDDNTLLLIHSDTTNGSTTFTDSSGVGAGLGNDFSGNANHWTPTNLAATDQMLDSPTNNFATLNPLDKGSSVTLQEGNLKVLDLDTDSNSLVVSNIAVSSGKFYFEHHVNHEDTDYTHLGIADTSGYDVRSFGSYVGSRADQWSIFLSNGNKRNAASYDSYGSGFTTGDIAMCAIDMDSGKVWWGKNGTWFNSGDPAAGTNAAFTNVSGDIKAAFTARDTGEFNFGQDSSFAGNKTAQSNTDDNGYGDFYYSPPTDYLALCTQNLDDPAVIPSEHFGILTWSGNSTDNRQITGLGFQPDLVWFKDRTNGQWWHELVDVIRGHDTAVFSNTTSAEASYTDKIHSFDSDGITIGTNDRINDVGDEYVAWCWKANGSPVSNTDGSITSSVSANTDAGFSIVSWTGTETNSTLGHGLTKAPEMIIVKGRETTEPWFVYHIATGNTDRLQLNSNTTPYASVQYWNNTTPTSSVFTVGINDGTNDLNNEMIAYCFHSVEGYSKVGSYTGLNNVADNVFVYTGFKPRYLIVKPVSVVNPGAHWYIYDSTRSTYNGASDSLVADSSAAENGAESWTAEETAIDFLSNGFKPRNSNMSSGTGQDYIYIAFAETDFKHSNAR